MMNHSYHYLEKTMEDADRKLETLSWRMERLERTASEVSLVDPEEMEEASVLNLLHDVTQVKEDYAQLRNDISEIQQLQKQMTDCLRSQVNQVHSKYCFLRSKLGPTLPSGFLMNTNPYNHSPVKQPNGIPHQTQSPAQR